jgi:ATP-dependent helicase YprA (DUF1998 family)
MQAQLELISLATGPGRFHPAVESWLRERFGNPTEVQTKAWEVTTQHRSALIAAPTGSGKTLAAFLSAINDLVLEGLYQGLSDEVYILYISPLKALSNDIQSRRTCRSRSKGSGASWSNSAARMCRSATPYALATRLPSSASACGSCRRISW